MSIIKSNAVAPPPASGGSLSSISEMNSLRFDGSSYLSRTFGTPTDSTKYTLSFWIKRTTLGSDQFITSRLVSPYYDAGSNFNASDNIVIGDHNAGKVTSSAKFRDTSSWYHFISQRNDANGNLVLWANGVKFQETPATIATSYNSAGYNVIGALNYNGYRYYFNGYLANIHFVDGQALDANSFGETVSDIWVPKQYGSGDPSNASQVLAEYGANGFHLDFAASNMDFSNNKVLDASGRGNDWTLN